jgi:hypothetical protein
MSFVSPLPGFIALSTESLLGGPKHLIRQQFRQPQGALRFESGATGLANRSADAQYHAVVAGLDPGRQVGLQPCPIHINSHMSQHGAAWS